MTDLRSPVRAFLRGEIDADRLGAVLAGSSDPDVGFWRGAALVEQGRLEEAAADLRRWLAVRDVGGGDDPLGECGEMMLRTAQSDLLEAADWLVRRRGPRWIGRCPFPADRVVREAAARRPDLLLDLLAGDPRPLVLAPGTRAAAARAVLDLALSAEHSGLAYARATLALDLLAEV